MELVSLPVIRDRSRIFLVDTNGHFRPISGQFREPTPDDIERMRWMVSLERSIRSLKGSVTRAVSSGWLKRCQNWMIHFKFAQMDRDNRPRKVGRYFNKNSRPDWQAACRCMWHQGVNDLRKGKRDEWNKWADSVTRNASRRSVARAKSDDAIADGAG